MWNKWDWGTVTGSRLPHELQGSAGILNPCSHSSTDVYVAFLVHRRKKLRKSDFQVKDHVYSKLKNLVGCVPLL